MKRDYIYKKTIHEGIFKHPKSGRYCARKKIYGKQHQETFLNIRDAIHWRKTFNGLDKSKTKEKYSTLKEVWESMQRLHFPKLSTSTKQVWIRRYDLLKQLEHLPMNEITSTKINEWLEHWVDYFKSEEWQASGSGKHARCSLKNELNLFVTIFNWYKSEDEFESESKLLTIPVRSRHKIMAFIKDLPQKDKKITAEETLLFLSYLPPLYRDLATTQYYFAGRIGEISGIQIKNINLEKRILKIKDSCIWCNTNKTFVELKPFPKNTEIREVYLHDEIMKVIQNRLKLRHPDSDYLFHVEGKPLNYATIQINYRGALRKSGLPYTGTHILRHGMATLARKIGGGLDSVMAMTGHKTTKLADLYSKIPHEAQREVSLKIEQHLKSIQRENLLKNNSDQSENVLAFPRSMS